MTAAHGLLADLNNPNRVWTMTELEAVDPKLAERVRRELGWAQKRRPAAGVPSPFNTEETT